MAYKGREAWRGWWRQRGGSATMKMKDVYQRMGLEKLGASPALTLISSVLKFKLLQQKMYNVHMTVRRSGEK